MSGGSYDYVFSRVEEMADNLRITSPLRQALQDHLYKVAKAMHDIEWVDSNDYGRGDDEEAIRACLPPGAELAAATKQAEKALAELTAVLREAKEAS